MIWSEVLAVGPLVTVHCYALGTAAALTGFPVQKAWLIRVAVAVLGLTFGLHSVLLAATFLAGTVSLSGYVSLMAWSVMLAGLLCVARGRKALLVVLAPITLLVYLAGMLMNPVPLNTGLSGMFAVVHVGALFGAMALLALAFGAGCLFLLQERGIKSKTRMTPLGREIPALAVLDRLNALSVSIGFPLFTVGLLTGFVGARVAFGRLLTGEVKELVSLFVWAMFAVVYHQRLVGGWQGRKPAVLTMIVFVVCVFSLTVINMLMPEHHGALIHLG